MARVKGSKRRAPQGRAAEFRINTVKRGVDGRSWIVKKREDGNKAWYRHSSGGISNPSRKGPPYVASKFETGTLKRGNDGCLYYVRKFRRIPRWTMATGGPKCGKWLPNTRRAPTAAASSFRVGHVAIGRNKRRWRVVQDVRGTKGWRQLPKAGNGKNISVPKAKRVILSYA